MPRSSLFLVLLLGLGLPACDEREVPVGTAEPEDFIVIRSYGWDTSVPEPQAEWSPADWKVLCRSVRGLMILREGHRGQNAYRTADATEVWDPRWLNGQQFVYGPISTPSKSADGSLTEPNYGIQKGSIINGQLGKIEELATGGVRPRPWGADKVLAQKGAMIVAYELDGDEELVDEGFFPAPRADGVGLAYQTVPVFHEDHWTGKQVPGDLVIRWGDNKVDIVPGGVEAIWTPQGGVLTTVMQAAPKAGQAWYEVPTKIMHIAGPGQEPQLVLVDGRSPRPHPNQPVMAAIDNSGQVVLMRIDGLGKRRVLSPIGERPRWSFDGRRIMIQEPHESDTGQRYLSVMVFRIKGVDA